MIPYQVHIVFAYTTKYINIRQNIKIEKTESCEVQKIASILIFIFVHVA